MPQSISEIFVEVDFKNDKLKSGLRDAERDLKRFEKNTNDMANTLEKAFKYSGAAVAAGLGFALKTGMDFEAQMSRVGAIAGANAEDLKALTKTAIDLGEATSMTATQVAQAMEQMATMGFQAKDIIAAMPGVISAAEASGQDLAIVSETMAAALNSFGMQAKDASRVADILAAAANASAANVTDMYYSFKYAAPVAHQFGMSIEELAAATGIMANAGIKGETAGTTLRSVLLSLMSPTKKGAEAIKELGLEIEDSSGKIKPFGEILAQLEAKTRNMTQAQKAHVLEMLFGKEAISGMLALLEKGSKEYDNFTKAMQNSAGMSAKAAQQMKDNVKGAMEQMKGSIEAASIDLYKQAAPALKDLFMNITHFINQGIDSGKFRELGKTIGDVVGALKDLDLGLAVGALKFTLVGSGVATLTARIGNLIMALRAGELALGPVGWLSLGLGVVAGLLATTGDEMGQLTEETLKNAQAALDETKQLDQMMTEYDLLRGKLRLTNDEFGRYLDINSLIQKTSDPAIIQKLQQEQQQLAAKSGLSNQELARMVTLNQQLAEKIPGAITEISKQGNAISFNTEKQREYNAAKREQIRLDLEARAAQLQADMRNNLEKEKELMAEIAQHQREIASTEEKIVQVQDFIRLKQDEINQRKAQGLSYDSSDLIRAQQYLDHLLHQRAQEANIVAEKNKQLNDLRDQIKQYDHIRQQLISIYFENTQIAGEQGDLVSLAKQQIAKNNQQIEQLRNMKGLDQAGRLAVQDKIKDLKEQNRKLQEAINKAEQLNYVLDQDVHKTVSVDVKVHTTPDGIPYVHVPGGRIFHSGGIVPGTGDVPILAKGGEAILTKSQQRNLLALLDNPPRPNGKADTGDTYNINVYNYTDDRKVGYTIAKAVERELWKYA